MFLDRHRESLKQCQVALNFSATLVLGTPPSERLKLTRHIPMLVEPRHNDMTVSYKHLSPLDAGSSMIFTALDNREDKPYSSV